MILRYRLRTNVSTFPKHVSLGPFPKNGHGGENVYATTIRTNQVCHLPGAIVISMARRLSNGELFSSDH